MLNVHLRSVWTVQDKLDAHSHKSDDMLPDINRQLYVSIYQMIS